MNRASRWGVQGIFALALIWVWMDGHRRIDEGGLDGPSPRPLPFWAVNPAPPSPPPPPQAEAEATEAIALPESLRGSCEAGRCLAAEIRQSVDPEGWERPGRFIEHLDWILFVRSSPEVHRRIREFLERAAAR